MDFDDLMKKLRASLQGVQQGAHAIGNAPAAPDLSRMLGGMQPPGGPPAMPGPLGSFQGIRSPSAGLSDILSKLSAAAKPVTDPMNKVLADLYNKIFQ